MFSTGEELAARTKFYWDLSLLWQGRSHETKPLTTSSALSVCNTNMSKLSPERPLSLRFWKLQGAIIQGRKREKKTLRQNVINLESRRA